VTEILCSIAPTVEHGGYRADARYRSAR